MLCQTKKKKKNLLFNGHLADTYELNRSPDITPLVTLDEQKRLYLLELFCGPTFAFKDVALQFLGNLFEYFLVRRNEVTNFHR